MFGICVCVVVWSICVCGCLDYLCAWLFGLFVCLVVWIICVCGCLGICGRGCLEYLCAWLFGVFVCVVVWVFVCFWRGLCVFLVYAICLCGFDQGVNSFGDLVLRRSNFRCRRTQKRANGIRRIIKV